MYLRKKFIIMHSKNRFSYEFSSQRNNPLINVNPTNIPIKCQTLKNTTFLKDFNEILKG